jgi:3-phenylpropionate/trans-cinnamate dioxygenase ferredoxin reductase subunit
MLIKKIFYFFAFFLLIIHIIYPHEAHLKREKKQNQTKSQKKAEQKADKTKVSKDKNQQKSDISLKEILTTAGRLSGLIAFSLFCLVFLVGASSRLWDKYLGLNNVLRWHKYFAVVSFSILLIHPITFFFAGLYSIGDFSNFYLTAGLIAFILLSLIAITSLLYKFMNRLFWIWLHRLSILAIILGAYHLLNYGFWVLKYPGLRYMIYTGLFIAFIGVVLRIYCFIKFKKYSTEVISVEKETHDTYTLMLKKPQDFNHESGQFCIISFKEKGMKKPHPFTISCSPGNDNVTFTIKSHRKFTSNVRNLKNGTKAFIDGPYGIFTFNYRKSVFIAGGVGITPFESMLENDNIIKKNVNIILLYGSRTKNDIIFYNRLNQINSDNDNIDIVNVLSHEKDSDFKTGFVDEKLIKDYANYSEDFYICGPPKMIKKIKKILKENNVPNRLIFTEKFFMIK